MLTANNMSAALYTIIITWTLWEIGIMIVSGIAAIAKKEEFKMDNTLPTVKFDGWYFFRVFYVGKNNRKMSAKTWIYCR